MLAVTRVFPGGAGGAKLLVATFPGELSVPSTETPRIWNILQTLFVITQLVEVEVPDNVQTAFDGLPTALE